MIIAKLFNNHFMFLSFPALVLMKCQNSENFSTKVWHYTIALTKYKSRQNFNLKMQIT
ncbi:hypothetical protein [Helicobacter pullorum]|uniref:hypothetical protein n=1 Tax=Helicobacter pullorum TaxID=35818 RepID=UPI00174C2E29|nr:hypothetical protein [Helicobacter pullorum]